MTRTVCGRCEMDKCQCKTIRATEMTRDNIIRMAREAGLALYVNDVTEEPYALTLERFAALVAAAEREAIGNIILDCAAAIRARDGV